MAENSPSEKTNTLGLKPFNRTGREDTTDEVLRPKSDPVAARRNVVLIAMVIVAFSIAAFFVFQRSGLDFKTIANDPGSSFGQGRAEQNLEATEKGE